MMLRGLLLLSLLVSGFRGMEQEKTLDEETLVPAINFLRKHYQPQPDMQYAIAFNAPADKCADYLDNNFLNTYPSQTVKNAINSAERVYKGNLLIAARPKPIPNKYPPINQHSEYLLLKVPSVDQSLMKNLLNKDKSGCVVFYTYNSPCTSTCTKKGGCYNIIDALDMFQKHSGPKAFVFTKVWKRDCDKDISANLKEVLKRVPLYHCADNKCVACGNNNLNDCMSNRTG